MSGDKMTPGDIAGMTAGDIAGEKAKMAPASAADSGQELTEKEKTQRE